jgi:hypothetical protein
MPATAVLVWMEIREEDFLHWRMFRERREASDPMNPVKIEP